MVVKPKRNFLLAAAALLICLALAGLPAFSQKSGPLEPGPKRPGSVSRPPAEDEDLPRIETKGPRRAPESDALFTSETRVVTVDVSVIDKNGNFIPNIPKQYFQVLEDGKPQKIQSFGQDSDAPMTVCLLIEFSDMFQSYWSETWYQTLTAAYGFIDTLQPQDWVALVAYDLRPEILVDFTQDKRKILEGMRRLQIAGFREANLYDAVTDMAQRMQDIEGRKSIVLISSGMDTFSKLTFGKTRKILQDAGVTIYSIGMMQALRMWADSRGRMSSITRLDFLQADNQLRTFSRETGGMAFFPRFYGEFPSIFKAIHYSMRNQYSLTYQPSNTKRDGEWREIEVRLIDPKNNKDLRIVNKKGKTIKYDILAKNGYYAPRPVE